MNKQLIKGKRKARRLALQALYQWLMSGSDLNQIETQFRLENATKQIDWPYFNQLLYDIPKTLTKVEEGFTPYIDRDVDDLNPVERTILRISTYELMHCLDTPYKVVLDEGIMMAKEFGSQDGYKYVNGVLNQAAQSHRKIEIDSKDG